MMQAKKYNNPIRVLYTRASVHGRQSLFQRFCHTRVSPPWMP